MRKVIIFLSSRVFSLQVFQASIRIGKPNLIIPKTMIVHDVSNMLPILKSFQKQTFDLEIEKRILSQLEIATNRNLFESVSQRIAVGSTISKTSVNGFIFKGNEHNVTVSPGVYSSFWGFRDCELQKKLYPNLEYNHVYLEQKENHYDKEQKVDYNGAMIGKNNLQNIGRLILFSSDGNNKEKYGFRNLVNDAIKCNREVVVVGMSPSKYYKKLASEGKIQLFVVSSIDSLVEKYDFYDIPFKKTK